MLQKYSAIQYHDILMLTITIMITIGYHDNRLITTIAQLYSDRQYSIPNALNCSYKQIEVAILNVFEFVNFLMFMLINMCMHINYQALRNSLKNLQPVHDTRYNHGTSV